MALGVLPLSALGLGRAMWTVAPSLLKSGFEWPSAIRKCVQGWVWPRTLAWHWRRMASGSRKYGVITATRIAALSGDRRLAQCGLAEQRVEIGDGFGVVAQHGSEHGDEMYPDGFASNHAGGVLGGIASGQEIRVSIAIKPTSSILSPKHSIDIDGKPMTLQTKGRHDPCVGIRATPIAEAMMALVLMDHALRHRAQCGDVMLDVAPIAAARPGSSNTN